MTRRWLGVFFGCAIFFSVGEAWARPVLLVYGDSLSAGYRLKTPDGFAPQLARHLEAKGWDIDVRNASVSGETTSGGLARLIWTLADLPEGVPIVVLLELGANDALRGHNPVETEKNLDRMITQIRELGMEPLLAGMRSPINMGRAYRRAFDGIYPRLAEKHGIVLYPFFLEGVALQRSLNLLDGIHPNPKGVARIVEGIAPYVEKSLRRVGIAGGEGGASESGGWFW